MPLPEVPKYQKLSPEQAEAVKREIRESLRIETVDLDFGTVRESQPVQLNVRYSLAATNP